MHRGGERGATRQSDSAKRLCERIMEQNLPPEIVEEFVGMGGP